MSKLDKDQVLADFTEAYQAAHGKEPQIEAKGGWYSVDGGKNVRLAALVDMAAELAGAESSGGDKAAETPAAEAKAEKPAKKKAAKKKAAPVTTASAGFTVVSAGDGLKPGDLWKQQIAQGSTLPRGVN